MAARSATESSRSSRSSRETQRLPYPAEPRTLGTSTSKPASASDCHTAENIRVASDSGPPWMCTTDAPASASAGVGRREPEARHLLAVGRRDPVHGRGDQPVAQLGGYRGAAVDQLGHRAGAGVDAEDRARVGGRHRSDHEAGAVGGPAHRQRDDRLEVDVDAVGAVGLVDRQGVEAVDVVADEHRGAVAREQGTQVVLVVLDQQPPAAVEVEVPHRVEVAVVVGDARPGRRRRRAQPATWWLACSSGLVRAPEPSDLPAVRPARSPCRWAAG